MSHETIVRARNILSASPIPEIRNLILEAVGEELCLRGNLRQYYHKQVAQETLRRICREAHIVLRNGISVTISEKEE